MQSDAHCKESITCMELGQKRHPSTSDLPAKVRSLHRRSPCLRNLSPRRGICANEFGVTNLELRTWSYELGVTNLGHELGVTNLELRT